MEEDVMASQVLEIICGFSAETPQFPEPEGRDDLSAEDGDDSVFYSDEDQAEDHLKANRPRDAGRCRRLYNSEVTSVDAPPSERNEGDLPVLCSEEGTKPRALETEQRCQADGDSEVETHEPERPEDSALSDEEEQGQAPSIEAFPGESLSNQLGSSSESEEEDSNIKDSNVAPVGPVPGYSTLPLTKKRPNNPGQQKSFDHLMASKFSSVSYRKIRRGNTRQKIEEFEYIMMNL
ncbi:uncharacterized protein LOC133537882 [Nerophis ophidion]|uniref:uncharacterized protein LOC133537882 n=1 Tax=Nerophis ophidion TaxID=159077 RepID=UPI002ADFA248|nr:uncharacterized protein LOC133537882 [Nerophis ophidion]